MAGSGRGGLFLGGLLDDQGERTEQNLVYDASDLTTHGVIVGMTGSGKTGLGVILIEELARSGIPTIVIDPKGDMGNLLLTFPNLAPQDFGPWVEAEKARRKGITVEELQAKTADLWRNGLASWGLTPDDIRALKSATDSTIYTPGSSAGVPLNILGSLVAPKGDQARDAEAIHEEIEGYVSGLLGMVGIHEEPLVSREHILLSNLIQHAWQNGRDLGLADLLMQVQQPPLRKLGVFDLDTFFPENKRMALAMRLNGLLASPGFETWLTGEPLDIGSMLWTPDGRPRTSVVYLSHLSEDERQFVVTLLMSKVVSWMRGQSGSSSLRAAIYMDEVFGFVPPTAAPPSKKPILTLLKQARAFGIGLVLSTQNPVDLDYKAMSNAGTWMVGRLQTERDKMRILEALQSARGDSDTSLLDRQISGLGKRQFLLHTTRRPNAALFTTRWAMSYLRGPLTRDQVTKLVGDRTAESPQVREVPTQAPVREPVQAPVAQTPALADDESPIAPKVADGTTVVYLDPGAPWARDVGAEPDSRRLQAALAVRVHLTFDDRAADLDHREEWEAVLTPIDKNINPDLASSVDYDDRDFRREPPEGAVYVLPDAPIHTKTFFKTAARELKDFLYRNRQVDIFRNSALKLYSRVGETREKFARRCDREAQKLADAEVAKQRNRFESKLRTLQRKIDTAERQLSDAEAALSADRQQELLSGAGSLLSIFLGGRSNSRSMASRAARSAGGFSSRRSRSSRTARKVETAQEKIEDTRADIDDLEQDFLEMSREVNDKWTFKAVDIEDVEVGLEKNDIALDELVLLWMPTR